MTYGLNGVSFPHHDHALQDARLLISYLKRSEVWAFFVSTEDEVPTPGVLNIYVPKSEWATLRDRLYIKSEPVDQDTDFITYRYNAVAVSFITEEKS